MNKITHMLDALKYVMVRFVYAFKLLPAAVTFLIQIW